MSKEDYDRNSVEKRDTMDNQFNNDKRYTTGRFTNVNDSKYDAPLNDSNPMEATIKYEFKVILLGDVSVGKTCILNRFTTNFYTSKTDATMSLTASTKNLQLDQQTVASLEIWDTCGEEKFRHVGRSYYKNIHGVILVFDTTNRKSFEMLDSWLEDIETNGSKDSVIMIVGNKCDMSEKRVVSSEEGRAFAEKNNFDYFDVSALSGNNIALSFEILTNKIHEKCVIEGFTSSKNKVNITMSDIAGIQKKGCC